MDDAHFVKGPSTKDTAPPSASEALRFIPLNIWYTVSQLPVHAKPGLAGYLRIRLVLEHSESTCVQLLRVSHVVSMYCQQQ